MKIGKKKEEGSGGLSRGERVIYIQFKSTTDQINSNQALPPISVSRASPRPFLPFSSSIPQLRGLIAISVGVAIPYDTITIPPVIAHYYNFVLSQQRLNPVPFKPEPYRLKKTTHPIENRCKLRSIVAVCRFFHFEIKQIMPRRCTPPKIISVLNGSDFAATVNQLPIHL